MFPWGRPQVGWPGKKFNSAAMCVAMNLNPHHLELFYFVVHHSGVSEAARNMPYGICPSSISRQLCQLEKQIGMPLCRRRPFKLTEPGEQLFTFIKPFFAEMPVFIDQLRRGVPDLVRLGAFPIVLREYMPSMVRSLRRSSPRLRFTFNEGPQGQIEDWLKEKRIDLAVTLLEGIPPAGCLSEPLLSLPMILLAPVRSKVRKAADVWRRGAIPKTLICPNLQHAISRGFFEELQRRKIEWPVGMEANSIELVETYVKNGLGIGLSLKVPGRKPPDGLRRLPLPDFPRVDVGMIWRRNPNAATSVVVEELRRQAKRLLALKD